MATYLILNLLFLGVLATIMLVWRVKLPRKPLLITLATVLFLTLIFDALFIALKIYAYNPEAILPVKIINIPPEDFAYAIAAAIFIPYLWKLLEGSPREA